ncbi:MAG: hypothetical protein PHH01_02670 [Patescibacteria group bacterium]|nr:hypothetical protein [Patescibacteria group bacterium]MDD5567074.1 hypothetical protein [Patescibacteria group bacterium]
MWYPRDLLDILYDRQGYSVTIDQADLKLLPLPGPPMTLLTALIEQD